MQSSVTNEADVLISRPTTTLAASAAAAGDTSKQTQTNPQAMASSQVAGAANAAAVNPMANQAEQTADQAARAQSAANSGAATRTIAQLASSNNATGGQAQTGTGEGFAGAGAQTTGQTTSTQQTAQSHAAQPQRFTLPQHTVVDQISVQITKALQNGTDRINIQLRPESLGRVDVRMELSHDGRVTATVTADNKDTLDMLQRDARGLEKALQDAGLQTDSGSLSFNLRGQKGDGGDGETNLARGLDGSDPEDTADMAPEEVLPLAEFEGGIRPDGRIDIRA